MALQHTAYPTFVRLDVHVSVGVPVDTVAPETGIVFCTAAGGGAAACTVNVRQPSVAAASPALFSAFTCHSYVPPPVRLLPLTDVPELTACHAAEQAPSTTSSRQ